MRLAIFAIAAVIALAALAPACARSVDGGTCTEPIGYPQTDDCKQCMANTCGGETTSAYGPDWQVPHLGGACASFTACRCGCLVPDVNCAITCAAAQTNDCIAARDRLSACVDKSCRVACTPKQTDAGITDATVPRG